MNTHKHIDAHVLSNMRYNCLDTRQAVTLFLIGGFERAVLVQNDMS